MCPSDAEVEAAWNVYLSVDPQTWGISHMRAALAAAEGVRCQETCVRKPIPDFGAGDAPWDGD